MFFDELSNEEWAMVASLVAEGEVREHRRGRPRAHPRTIVNAVLWILTTGETWSKLPSHYPTVPTCRRRFNDWQMNGTLIEMVTRLASRGRSFAIVPSMPAEVQPRPAQPAYECDRLRGVFWQNPESWGGSDGGSENAVDALFAPVPRRLAEAHDVARANAPTPLSPSRAAMVNNASRAVHRGTSGVPARDPSPMAFEPDCAPVHDGHGYVIYAIARPVAGSMFRGWAEIVKDGRRVERSGLIGPRHENAEEAAGYALEWSRRWIAAQSTRVTHPVQATADAPQRVVPAAAASNHASDHPSSPASDHVRNEPQHEGTATPERVETRRYADVQG
ncbi:transposase [Caballeronia sp. SEWSISQ10-4 2]|uniref:transposase n=1 Tax=Caballeronia sp. SEWSISQ10-4 2 TaxID=2937438 RepID=UPI0026561DE7|nr:transposase [Caballeronia sp. SEWSISQ10-4 2]MDN7183793.1 transposase [Caballeronia sp. SEWSISQ10-4 2]